MYKCKIFKGTSIETDMNNLFQKLPVDAKIISIEYITSPSGNLNGGYGKIVAEPKILVVWEE